MSSLLTLRLGFALMMSFSGGVIGLVLGNVIQTVWEPGRTIAWTVAFMGLILGLMIGLTSDDSVVSSPEALEEIQEKRKESAKRLLEIRPLAGLGATAFALALVYGGYWYATKQTSLWSMEGIPSLAAGLAGASLFGRGLGAFMCSLRPVTLAGLVIAEEYARAGATQVFLVEAGIIGVGSLAIGALVTWRAVSALRPAPQELQSIID